MSSFVTDAVSQSCLPAALHDGVAVPEKRTVVEPGSAPTVAAVADWSNDALPKVVNQPWAVAKSSVKARDRSSRSRALTAVRSPPAMMPLPPPYDDPDPVRVV
ncbi:MAG: hypothetical protein ACTIME_12170 [Cellulosimicrobium funkei]|uniref:hypothetical protein n=1 Tax=Cellulosimicrobium funkei TaxID=264251 RepID=UPI003F99A2CC